MNKLTKTILISTIFLGAGFLTALPAFAVQVDNLVVEYWSEAENNWLPLQGPIFSETNFLPGNDVIRLIRVTNYSEQTQRIAVEAINKSDPDDFASQLNLVIKEGAKVIFNNTLAQFFSQGETYLSDLNGSGGQTQYDFKITFNSASNNSWQEKNLGFNILVGFEGTEGGLTPLSPGQGIAGGGNGPPGGLPPGLTIQNETNVQATTTSSVTIFWDTSYPATSQVIYALENEAHTLNLFDNAGSPPKYGYYRTTPESDIFLKVVNHSVTIPGLTPGTTYYYRAVSHGSLAISTEHSFTTLTPEETMALVETGAGTVQPPQPAGGQPVPPAEGNIQGGAVGTTTGTGEKSVSTGLAASILGLSGSWIFWIILFLILMIILFLVNKKKKKNN
jgi:hypothetical protein